MCDFPALRQVGEDSLPHGPRLRNHEPGLLPGQERVRRRIGKRCLDDGDRVSRRFPPGLGPRPQDDAGRLVVGFRNDCGRLVPSCGEHLRHLRSGGRNLGLGIDRVVELFVGRLRLAVFGPSRTRAFVRRRHHRDTVDVEDASTQLTVGPGDAGEEGPHLGRVVSAEAGREPRVADLVGRHRRAVRGCRGCRGCCGHRITCLRTEAEHHPPCGVRRAPGRACPPRRPACRGHGPSQSTARPSAR